MEILLFMMCLNNCFRQQQQQQQQQEQYIHVYICIHTHIYICIHTHIHTRIHTRIPIPTPTHTHDPDSHCYITLGSKMRLELIADMEHLLISLHDLRSVIEPRLLMKMAAHVPARYRNLFPTDTTSSLY